MRRAAVAALLLAGCGQSEDAARREIVAGEARWTMAGLRHDGAGVAALLADDYVGVNPDGSLANKAQMVAEAAAGPGRQVAAEPGPVSIRFAGGAALAQGSSRWARADGSTGRYVWADSWVRRDGRWQVAMSADVEVPDRPAAPPR